MFEFLQTNIPNLFFVWNSGSKGWTNTANYYTTTLNDFNNDRLYDYNCVYKYELGNNKVYMVDDYRNGKFNVNIQNNDL